MKLIIFGVVLALLSFIVSLCFYLRGKCNVWTVIISPVVGFFSYVLLILILIFISGDM